MSDIAKKRELREEIRNLRGENDALKGEVRVFKRELDSMRKHWRPVPMMHQWQPRNPQCALCDDTRDAPRHQVDTE